MLPTFRLRLMIGAAVVAGGLVWMLAGPALRAVDGSAGISVFDASAGGLGAMVVVLACGLLAVALGVMVAAMGNPLSGVFVVATSLAFLAGAGGPIRGYLWRNEARLPGAYGWLMAETALWMLGLVALLALIAAARPRVRQALGAMATDQHYGHDLTLGAPRGGALLAGLLCGVIGAGLANLLIQSDDGGQVIGSLILAFTLAGLLAQMIVPQANPVAILLSPGLAAMAGYGYVLMNPRLVTTDAVLSAWYHEALWGLALALPIHYVSAGVAGCALGVGLAQSLEHARAQAAGAQGE